MKKIHFITVLILIVVAAPLAFAADEKASSSNQQPGPKAILQQFGFVDEDGDGINDLARDADNDGIPNCTDPDWTRPQDGTGYMNRFGGKHQNANQQNGGLYNHGNNHRWNNNWANGNPNFCNQGSPSGRNNRNRRANRGN